MILWITFHIGKIGKNFLMPRLNSFIVIRYRLENGKR